MFSRFFKPWFLTTTRFNQILASLILCGVLGSVSHNKSSWAATNTSPQTKSNEVSTHTNLRKNWEPTSSRLLSTQASDVIIVDAGIADPWVLLNDLPNQENIHFLSPNIDGLNQISDILSNYRDLNSVHLISHGESAQLHLGNSRVTSATLNHKAGQVQQWQAALLPTADIFLYGCNDVATLDGQAFNALANDSNTNRPILEFLDANDIFINRLQSAIDYKGKDRKRSSSQFDYRLVQDRKNKFLMATDIVFSAQEIDGNSNFDPDQYTGKKGHSGSNSSDRALIQLI